MKNGDVLYTHHGNSAFESFEYVDLDYGGYYYIRLTQVDGYKAWASPIWVQRSFKGDANLDGIINVLDVLTVVNYILGIQQFEGNEYDRADCNQDGTINILDALGIVNVVLEISDCEP